MRVVKVHLRGSRTQVELYFDRRLRYKQRFHDFPDHAGISNLINFVHSIISLTIAQILISYYNLSRICASLWVGAFYFKRLLLKPRTNHPGGALFYFPNKECAVRPALICLILVVILSLTSCTSQTTQTISLPGIKPSISGLVIHEVDQPTAERIRQHMGPFLESNPYTEYKTGSQLLLYLVSSGEFTQAEITLTSGETYQADVLYALALMSSRRVLVAPVLIGLKLPDEHYGYFSEKYAYETEASVTTTSADRETALADARNRLPRGRIFRLLAYGMASLDGLDWEKCPSVSYFPPEICQVGALVEQLYPNQTKSFVLRLAHEFSPNWLLAGWVFQEFAPEELVPGASIDVPLAERSQP
jgi:hypothetical protein